jgi:N-acetylneuraminic acid mutarotase
MTNKNQTQLNMLSPLIKAGCSIIIILTAITLLPLSFAQSGGQAASADQPQTCAVAAGPNLPTVLVRGVGVYFPADGNFYSVGGRTADTAGSDFQHVLRYTPGTNTWTQMPSTLPDNTMNNMACGVLTVSGTPYIYCVGGSAATQTTAAARVFFYNPATDTATTLATDNWPGDSAGTILPGGFAVANNKLYILGGFNINVASTNQIWQFDPNAAAGSRWTQMVNTPEGIMYAPTTTIGGIIYVGGASDYSGGTVIDTTNSFSFNPASNTLGTIAAIPRATGETRALNVGGQMYVIGGGRVAPNPSTEVDIYDPGTNSWSTGTPFVTPRRNFPTDTNGTDHIWLGGGYSTDGVTPLNTMEIFSCNAPLSITSAVSRKTHGAAGNFDINMPLSGPTGVEDRNTGGTHDYTLVVTFSQSVTVTGSPQAQVTSGTGCVGTGGVCSGNVSVSGAVVTVPLTNVADQQNINVRINSVNSSGNFNIPMGFLTGDTNANRTVNAADVAQTKSQLGQTVTAANFRNDLNANGTINAADTALIKQNSGHSLP